MTRFFSTLLAALMGITAFAQQFSTPDFAYPKTVVKNADASLTAALKTGNDPAALRALTDWYLAQAMTDTDSIPAAISRVDSVGHTLKSPAARALASLLRADIYTSLYMAKSWVYDRRDTPVTPLPELYTEWNGRQFAMVVNGLVDEALSDPAALKAVPLRDYDRLITQDAQTRIYYPTIYDFIARKSATLLTTMRGRTAGSVFPLFCLTAPQSAPFMAPGDPTAHRILEIYASLIASSEPQSAPWVSACLARTGFLCDNIAEATNTTRPDAFMRLYEQCLDPATGKPLSEWAGDILCDIPYFPDNTASTSRLYTTIRSFLADFPRYWRKGCLENTLRDMADKTVSLDMPRIAAPGRETSISVKARNIADLKLNIYDVSSSPVAESYYEVKTGVPAISPIGSIEVPVRSGGTTVPFALNDTVRYTFAKPGTYVVIPQFKDMEVNRRSNYQKIYVTGVSIAESRYDSTILWAIDPEDGAPIEGVDMFVRYDSRTNTRGDVKLGSTSKWGSLTMPKEKSGTVTAIKGADRFAFPQYAYSFGANRPAQWNKAVEGYSSLPLYHPGDTAEWCAVVYEYKNLMRRPLAGEQVKAVLTDPSGVELDTLTLTTDRWGRVASSFRLPEVSLSGSYSIRVADRWGVIRFTVSDYKLPSFLIGDTSVEQGVPEAGAVTLHGNVKTYSGFPLDGAKVTVELSVTRRPRWWMPGASYRFYATDTVAGADGSFAVPVDKDILASSPIPGGFFTATITALSPSGESQKTQISFTTSKQYIIKGTLPAQADVTSGHLAVKVSAADWRDSVVSVPVNYAVLDADSTTLLNGSVTGGAASIDVKTLPSGRYTFRFTLPEPYEAVPWTTETVIYRTDDRKTPCPGQLIWSPETKVYAGGKDGKWLYATDCPTHLLVTLVADDKVLSQGWVKADEGMHLLDVTLPDGVDRAKMTVAATGRYRSDTKYIDVIRAGSEKGIRIEAETFRDRLVPGSAETWRLRVVDLDGRGREAAVIADMYNTALDALATQSWQFNPAIQEMSRWNFDPTPFSDRGWVSRRGKGVPFNECAQLLDPAFETYGYGFGDSNRIYGARNGLMRQMKSSATQLMAVDEHKDEIVVEEAEMAADAAPLEEPMLTAKGAADAGGAAMQETEEGTAEEPQVNYRDSEVPLSFFRPELTTDADGNLELTFTVPDANTTWGMRAVAWTDSILTASHASDVLASKPVMVRPNLPRFLRSGDRVGVEALVMNATDSTLNVTATVETFNPSDGKVISTDVRELTIAPQASATVGITVNAPADAPFLGYRVKAVAGRWTDGEQNLIPLLPATTPVIETYPFYIAPDSTSYGMTLPTLPADGRLTLQLCENPVWYVVTALPGLLDREATTSPEAALSIFSAAIASGLLRDNPAIGEAIREWNASDRSSETLVSMLERNSELKTMLLQATPWMTDARNDTERMARLSLLFDRKLVDKTISANITLLSRLFNDGGWSWCSQYPTPSSWATDRVLELCGRLAQLGYLPADKTLRSMLVKALDADTREHVRAFRRYPKGDYTSYVVLHDMYAPLGIGKPDPRIVTATTNRMVARWRRNSLSGKAVDAMVLNTHGYQRVARTILGSIREFAKSSPEKGVWFPSLPAYDAVPATTLILQAFHAIEPGCVEIDGLRQWLTLQKGAQDWGSSAMTSDIVATFLTTSAKWLIPAEGCTVTVGGREVVPAKVERLTGDFTMPLPAASGSPLAITKPGTTPAWGAVYAQFTDSMAALKAASCPELSIEKTLLLKRAGGETEHIGPDTRLHPGDKVSVCLTVRCDMTMDYVVITDDRPACLEPVEQLPSPIFSEGLCFYRENRDASTRIFIDRLPKGVYLLTYDLWVNNAGTFTTGIATAQSQYAPRYTAHSAGGEMTIE